MGLFDGQHSDGILPNTKIVEKVSDLSANALGPFFEASLVTNILQKVHRVYGCSTACFCFGRPCTTKPPVCKHLGLLYHWSFCSQGRIPSMAGWAGYLQLAGFTLQQHRQALLATYDSRSAQLTFAVCCRLGTLQAQMRHQHPRPSRSGWLSKTALEGMSCSCGSMNPSNTFIVACVGNQCLWDSSRRLLSSKERAH